MSNISVESMPIEIEEKTKTNSGLGMTGASNSGW
jgi:hypothetical protein